MPTRADNRRALCIFPRFPYISPMPQSSPQKPLALIGMSGVGKSHWSRQLEQAGFAHLDCDARIAGRLGEIVTPNAGESPVHALGRWMGMPWSPGYGGAVAEYLRLEEAVTAQALDEALAKADGKTVIDTTGSVIYLSPALLSRLHASCHVAYLALPDDALDAMLLRFLKEPKPLVWGDAWAPKAGEKPEDALPRCYANLLAARGARYEKLAHVMLDGRALEEDEVSLPDFLRRAGL